MAAAACAPRIMPITRGPPNKKCASLVGVGAPSFEHGRLPHSIVVQLVTCSGLQPCHKAVLAQSASVQAMGHSGAWRQHVAGSMCRTCKLTTCCSMCRMEQQCMSWGMAWHGMAWHGMAWLSHY